MDDPQSWAITCALAQSHAKLMAKDCSTEAAEMILAATQAFCQQASPVSREEQKIRDMQHAALIGIKISNVAYADRTAGSYSAIARMILDAARELCERPLPTTSGELAVFHLQSQSLVGIKIASFIFADNMAKSHSRVATAIFGAMEVIGKLRLPVSQQELDAQSLAASEFDSAVLEIINAG